MAGWGALLFKNTAKRCQRSRPYLFPGPLVLRGHLAFAHHPHDRRPLTVGPIRAAILGGWRCLLGGPEGETGLFPFAGLSESIVAVAT